jgi:hypothetical protein
MVSHDWQSFLSQWSKELIAKKAKLYELPPEVIAGEWLGYPGATNEQIAAAEIRIGKPLPPSYREFLKLTNGWRQTGTCCVDQLWSTEEIDWHYSRHPYVVETWLDGEGRSGGPPSDESYFVYGEAQINAIRAEYFKASLEISDVGEGSVYLLNPEVVNADGEWEAWFFADWIPGAERYRSFWKLMQGEYEKFKRLEFRKANRQK